VHRPMKRIALCLLFAVAATASAQSAPTRAEIVEAVVNHRLSAYGQDLLVDGCSLSTAVDSVSRSVGTLTGALSRTVRGAPGRCALSDSVPGDPVHIAKVLWISSSRLEFLSDLDDDTRRTTFSLQMQVTNRRSSAFTLEEWGLRITRGGSIAVLGVRTVFGHKN
jgi:hypothetical protein